MKKRNEKELKYQTVKIAFVTSILVLIDKIIDLILKLTG